MKFTILGASGFIGRNMCQYLKARDIECFAPDRDYKFGTDNLGNVIYCIGLTADFRTRPLDTVKAHVCKLVEILEGAQFDSFVYLSTTRVYLNSTESGNELASLTVNPGRPDDLYNLSKLLGESTCLSLKNDSVKVVRLSNVIGEDMSSENFLFSILREIKETHALKLHSSIYSEKDYVDIDDVVELLYQISLHGKKRLYNIASGSNVSVSQILNQAQQVKEFPIDQPENAPVIKFPAINTDNVKEEFSFVPKNPLHRINDLILKYLK